MREVGKGARLRWWSTVRRYFPQQLFYLALPVETVKSTTHSPKTTNTFGRESCIFHVSILTLRNLGSIVDVFLAGGGSVDEIALSCCVESPGRGIVVSLGNNPCKRVKTDGW